MSRFSTSAIARAVAIVCAFVGVCLSAGEAAAQTSARKPNILLIMADDLGYGDLGSYGQKRIRTPNLDRLAAEGVRFTQFYAGAPVCAPSRAVLMTGQNVGRVIIRGNLRVDLRPQDVTVAQVLKQAGYATGLVGKWGLGKEGSTGEPRKKGFDAFFGYLDQTHAHNYYPQFLLRNEEHVELRNVVPNAGPFGQGVATERINYSADLIADEAVAFLERQTEKQPFFLFFAPTLPHANNEAGKLGMEVPDYGDYAREDWPDPQKGLAAMITRLDRDIGRLLATLDARGLARDTIVLFTSDNGPHREGGNDPTFFDSNGPLRGIKRDLYDGGIRVPLIVRWPGRAPAGTTSDHVAYVGDFLATAAEAARTIPRANQDGISFLPAILGKTGRAQRSHEFLYWEFYEGRGSQAVRLGNWKAVRTPMSTGPIELYDLATDIGEDHDLAAERPDIVERVRGIMTKAHVPSPLWQVQQPTP